MTAHKQSRWPNSSIPRKPVKARRFQPPSGGITFDQICAPGRADMTVNEFWKMRAKQGVK